MTQVHLNLKTMTFPPFLPFSWNHSKAVQRGRVIMGVGVQLSMRVGPERGEKGVSGGRLGAVVGWLGTLIPRWGDKESVYLGGWWWPQSSCQIPNWVRRRSVWLRVYMETKDRLHRGGSILWGNILRSVGVRFLAVRDENYKYGKRTEPHDSGLHWKCHCELGVFDIQRGI